MTPAEFWELCQAYEERLIQEQIRQYQYGAWLQTNIMRAIGSKVKPEELFDPEKIERERQKKETTEEERQRLLDIARERGIIDG